MPQAVEILKFQKWWDHCGVKEKVGGKT